MFFLGGVYMKVKWAQVGSGISWRCKISCNESTEIQMSVYMNLDKW